MSLCVFPFYQSLLYIFNYSMLLMLSFQKIFVYGKKTKKNIFDATFCNEKYIFLPDVTDSKISLYFAVDCPQ